MISRFLFGFIAALFLIQSTVAAFPRIKDLVEIEGVRGNDLVGFGLVVGLNGSGDTIGNSPWTEEAFKSLLDRLGVSLAGAEFEAANVAAVIVTATLPPFPRAGSRIDVTVSAIGDADSLLGGTLIMTPLNAADGEIYAVAQGSVLAGGVEAAGEAAEVNIGVPTAGTIPNGARIEREIPFVFDSMTEIRLALHDPDFTTARRIASAINSVLGADIARMEDASTITLNVAASGRNAANLISDIENIAVEPDLRARVVIDPRSGTIVLGADVKISSVAISQGNLTIRVEERPVVSQPNPFAPGETVIVPRTDIEIEEGEDGIGLALVEENVTLADLVDGLNALGVGPRDMIDILKAIKAAGALHAELIIQ